MNEPARAASSSPDTAAAAPRAFASFAEFYPYYLEQHAAPINRRLHFAGTSLGLATFITLAATQLWWFLPLALVPGYALAWIGHFGFERNKPASFNHPFYSFMGDWVMMRDILIGRVSI